MDRGKHQYRPGSAPSLRRLGKYELIARLGMGGMAEVHLARQTGPMNFQKVVVVKVIHPHLSREPQFVNMLLDEARISALIKHPRVVDIYDLGLADDTYFIAMEQLSGQSLVSLLKAGRHGKTLSVYSAARIVADAADGLDAAHNLTTMTGERLELVHRDVSPGNVIVLYDGSVKLVDFGVAKARGRVTDTEVGKLKGKLGYTSPEQLDDGALDARSDIFSLGVVMWELLGYRRLFNSESEAATINKISSGIVPAPSTLRPEVPAELDRICLRALALDPADRYQTAKQLQVHLENFLHDAGYSRDDNELRDYMQTTFGVARREQEALLRRVAEATEAIELEAELTEGRDRSAPAIGANLATGTSGQPELTDDELELVIEEDSLPEPSSAVEPPLLREPRRALWVAAVALLVVGIAVGVGLSTLRDSGSRSAQPATATQALRPLAPEPAAEPELEPAAEPELEPAAEPEPVAEPAAEPAAEPEPVPNPAQSEEPEQAAARTLDPALAAGLYNDGARLYIRGKLGAARTKYRAALDHDARYAPAHRGLGMVYERQGKAAAAVRAFERYLRLAPEARDAPRIRERIQRLQP